MSPLRILQGLRLCVLLATLFGTASAGRAGDSMYGTVIEVKRADLVTFDYGGGTYLVRISGIDVPADPKLAEAARAFVAALLLNKNCRLRLDGRGANGETNGRILTDDPELGVEDVGVVLVRDGLVSGVLDYRGYKYHEMLAAEEDAKKAERGIRKKPTK